MGIRTTGIKPKRRPAIIEVSLVAPHADRLDDSHLARRCAKVLEVRGELDQTRQEDGRDVPSEAGVFAVAERADAIGGQLALRVEAGCVCYFGWVSRGLGLWMMSVMGRRVGGYSGRTYEQHHHWCSRRDGLALDGGWLGGDAHGALRAGQALRLGDVGGECCVVGLLREGLDFGPDGDVVRAEEKLHDFVELESVRID